jgi:pentatricopeptide repeat protein
MDALFEGVEKKQRPSLQIWVTLIKRLADTSKLDPSLEVSINRTFRCILDSYPNAWPGNELLRIGLRTSEVTNDAGLISELIVREVQRKRGLHEKEKSRIEREGNDSGHLSTIPQMVFRKALEMALHNTDVESASSILTSLEDVHTDYPISARSELYGLVVLCYSRAGQSTKAKELLLSMVEEGMEALDDCFGAVLHSLVVDGKADEARILFRSMEDHETNLPNPDVSSYNAILVSHIQAREWDQAISLFDAMKEKGVAMNSQTFQGLLLAHVSRGGSEGAYAFLESMLRIQAPVDESIFHLASRIILPALGGNDTDEIRSKARKMGEEEPRLRDASVKVIRSARVAEVEDKKLKAKQSGTNRLGKFDAGESWKRALSDLLDFSREVAKTAAKNDS